MPKKSFLYARHFDQPLPPRLSERDRSLPNADHISDCVYILLFIINFYDLFSSLTSINSRRDLHLTETAGRDVPFVRNSPERE
jgi:hypothetical protein